MIVFVFLLVGTFNKFVLHVCGKMKGFLSVVTWRNHNKRALPFGEIQPPKKQIKRHWPNFFTLGPT